MTSRGSSSERENPNGNPGVGDDGRATSSPDRWGPSHILQVYDPRAGLEGILVIDNTVLGPGLGGIAITPTASVQNVMGRARTMTWTCALMDTGFGGAAACIKGRPSAASKDRLIRAFAEKVGFYVPWLFVATQDRNVGKGDMAVFAEQVGDWQGATGKPEWMQGIPHELGVVSFGIGVAIENCLGATDSWMSSPGGIEGARVAMLGHEATGTALARYLTRKGAAVVAICDEGCTIHNQEGIDAERIPKPPSSPGQKSQLRKVADTEVLPAMDITRVDCDVLVCVDDHEVLRSGIVRRSKARCIVEGVQGLLVPAICQHFHRNGVLVLPEPLVSAGGVVASCAEYQHIGTERAFSMIEARVGAATRRLIEEAHEKDVPILGLIEVAAQQRIASAMEGG